MSITDAQWRDIEKAADNYRRQVKNGYQSVSQVVPLGELKNIIRRTRRTNDQNALLWSLYEDVLKKGGETLAGWTKDDLHEYALGNYFGWDRHDAFGMRRVKPKRRSSRLTKAEFGDFVEAFVRQMAEHGIVLELPGDGEWPQC